MSWKVIDNGQSENGSFTVRYGEFQARIDVQNNPSWFETYTSRVYVWRSGDPYISGPMYECAFEISQDRIYKLVKRGDKITDAAVLKILSPAVDFAQFALFCCVVEKLI